MASRRPPGRPPLDAKDPSVKVCVTVPAHAYDRIYARAQQDRVTVPELIRRALDPTKKYPN
jgi:hypothetical protein